MSSNILKPTNKKAKPDYYGIADAHGIETFRPYRERAKDTFPYIMRANLNRQRHAVYYEITIDKKDAKVVNALISTEKYQKALEIIKKRAILIGFPKEHSVEYQDSWSLIPNPKLDPYR